MSNERVAAEDQEDLGPDCCRIWDSDVADFQCTDPEKLNRE
jgi:hypothetical protein